MIEFVNDSLHTASSDSAIAFMSFEDALVPLEIMNADPSLRDIFDRALSQNRFRGATGQVLDIIAPCGVSAARVVLVGCGPKAALVDLGLERAAAEAYRYVYASGAT